MNHARPPTNHGPLALAWLSGGVVVAGLFATAQLPPLGMTILLLVGLTIVGIASLRVTELSVMSRLFVLLFSLPFGATIGYLFDRDFVWWQTNSAMMLCLNHRLVNEMLAMAIVGLCGMMAGIAFTAVWIGKPQPVVPGPGAPGERNKPTLTVPIVLFLLAVSLYLSWMHAPKESIFVASYASADAGGAAAKDSGLNSSYLISYLILILLFVDIEQEQPGSARRTFKLTATMLVTGYIIVVLQLLRGDRECAGLVGALGMLYITSSRTAATRMRLKQGLLQMKRLMKLAVPLGACVMAFLALGSLRHSASQTSSSGRTVWQSITEGAMQNTWTAVALNNLGLAADYHYGNIEYLYGRTYVDYLLSLPPGPVAKMFGYDRPLDGDANPSVWYAWQSGSIACGGMQPVIVPFKNFGILGVLGVMFLLGAFICRCEIKNENGTVSARLVYGCVVTSSMLWFWYGDMNMIRTLMACGMLYLIHRFGANRIPSGVVRQVPRPRPAPRKLEAVVS